MPRAAMSDISISICGIINFAADFHRVSEPKGKGESFKMICGVCTDPTKPVQKYICPGCSGQFTSGELDRAREVGKTLVRVTQEEVEGVRTTDLPKGELRLSPYKANEVFASIRPDGVTYRVEATKFKDVAHMVLDLVQGSPDVVFLGEMNAGRGTSKAFSLAVWNDALVVQEMARPDEMVDFEPIHADYDPRLLAPATQFIGLQAESFTPADFANKRKARLAELDAAKVDGTTVSETAPAAAPEVSATDSLLAMLEAQIEVNRKAS